jgi:NADH dehydrogenase
VTKDLDENESPQPTNVRDVANENDAYAHAETDPQAQHVDSSKHHVVVVGAGFGGLATAQSLRKHDAVRVTVVDRTTYHLFAPLLYQVATAGLGSDDIVRPIRLQLPGVDFYQGSVVAVDSQKKFVRFADGRTLQYDDLVLAVGSVGSDFGIPGVAEYALQMKTLKQARAIRTRLLSMYEHVAQGMSKPSDLNVIVIGGGPTGVELTGAIAEMQRGMRKQYRDLARQASVTLVEAGPRLLPSFTEKSSQAACTSLERLGATVRTDTGVAAVEQRGVRFSDGSVRPAGTIIWAAGVKIEPVWDKLGIVDRQGRLEPSATLQLVDHIWVVGDMAHVDDADGKPLPMIAPVAMQGGRHVARQIRRGLAGEPFETFTYKDKGQMATIGRNHAVAEFPPGVRIHGFPAWVAWLGLHIVYLMGGRNRVSVLSDWAWNYLTSSGGPNRTVTD